MTEYSISVTSGRTDDGGQFVRVFTNVCTAQITNGNGYVVKVWATRTTGSLHELEAEVLRWAGSVVVGMQGAA